MSIQIFDLANANLYMRPKGVGAELARRMRSLRNETALTPIEAVRSKYERSVGSPVQGELSAQLTEGLYS